MPSGYKRGHRLMGNDDPRLSRHSKHHTSKHIAMMRALLKKGKSFKDAHAMAMRMVGK